MADEIVYPIQKFHFQVEWTDVIINCSEVNGLTISRETINYIDGKTGWATAQPGLERMNDVTLTKAVFESDEDYKTWYQKVEDKEDPYRDTVLISLLNELHEPVFTWELQNAFVTKWVHPDMDSMGNEVTVEELTLVCENIVTVIGE